VSNIRVNVSKRSLTLTPRPDGEAITDTRTSEFEVTVINDSSEFASFQLELGVQGIDPDASLEWYTIEPEVCAKKPPGASTTFKATILRSPLLVYNAPIDLLLKVFSVEFAHLSHTQKLSLTIASPQQPLSLSLLTKDLKVAPGDRVDIPVLVYNYSPNTVDVTLRCLELDATWLPNGTEQRLQVEPGYPTKAVFVCQLPPAPQVLQQSHPFTIEAHSEIRGRTPRETGRLEILALGAVEFRCSHRQQQIPTRRSSQRSGALYLLEVENASNTRQTVRVQEIEPVPDRCQVALPEPITLDPGQVHSLPLGVDRRRPWLGRTRRFWFDVAAEVLDPKLGDRSSPIQPTPRSHTLELQVLPVLPFWLQWLLLALLLGSLGILVWVSPPKFHEAATNVVRFNGQANTVFSGSSDQSIRSWQVQSDAWLPQHRLKPERVIDSNMGRAVRVIRPKPKDQNVIAAGLENGTILMLDVLNNRKKETPFERNDRVFDLIFTSDSNTLFSGHGSQQVRRWKVESDGLNLRLEEQYSAGFVVSALAIYEAAGTPEVVMGGQFNQLATWDWQNKKFYKIPYRLPDASLGTAKFDPVVGQQHYIESLAIAGHLLVTADNAGYIRTWDLKQRICNPAPKGRVSEPGSDSETEPPKPKPRPALEVIQCENVPVLDQWQQEAHNGQPVRAISLTEDGRFLASVGDDGWVKLWNLENGQRLEKQGRSLKPNFPGQRLQSVDIRVVNNSVDNSSNSNGYVLVTVGTPDGQIKLFREPIR
jgi:WD40 repeat protein